MANQTIKTPPKCTADFCLIPIGTPTASVSAQIADVQRLMKTSGLSYSMHSAGTTVVSCSGFCFPYPSSLALLSCFGSHVPIFPSTAIVPPICSLTLCIIIGPSICCALYHTHFPPSLPPSLTPVLHTGRLLDRRHDADRPSAHDAP
jgi:hypothetical protein